MVAKIWKKVLLIITVIAILYMVVAKLATKISYKDQMGLIEDYVKSTENVSNTNVDSRGQQ